VCRFTAWKERGKGERKKGRGGGEGMGDFVSREEKENSMPTSAIDLQLKLFASSQH